MPLLALGRPPNEAEVRTIVVRFSKAMRAWLARRGVAHGAVWCIERSVRHGVHFHALVRCPWRLRTEAKRHAREVLFGLLGVDLQAGVELDARVARAVRLHGRQGGVGATLAAGWVAYIMATVDPTTSFRAKAEAALPVAGRRYGKPKRSRPAPGGVAHDGA